MFGLINGQAINDAADSQLISGTFLGELGCQSRLVAFNNFADQVGDSETYYEMTLITPSGEVKVPISSWQATLQVSLSNFVQCVVPAVEDYIEAIGEATEFVIDRVVRVPGYGSLSYQMARSTIDTVTFDQGPTRFTATLRGYTSGFAPDEDPDPSTDRILTGIRSVSITSGLRRVRCSVDWLLRPNYRVTAQDQQFIASYINYYVGRNDAYMDVGERG